ncbi:hypothetical protein RNJ44_02669 [Nakaseomyces bracarensis]|uniref:Uncharacterized protein n=1 Tax=Nakaseomyces bracarensis TaxID=273131 RepID=A0ABR4NZY6_9SACH
MVTEYAGLRREIEGVRYKVNELENKVNKNDLESTNSIEDMLVAIKTIAYNQTVIESKFEDILKNQLNTDSMVNDMNERLNKITNILTNTKTAPILPNGNNSSTSHNNHNSNNNSYHSNNNTVGPRSGSSRRSSSNNSATNLVEQNAVVKRRPGRPRKDATIVNKLPLSVNWTVEGNSQKGNNSPGRPETLRPVKVTLPLGQTQVSKNKKYFGDPNDISLMANSSKNSTSQKETNEEERESSPEPVPPKKKRGRPPKRKSNVETQQAPAPIPRKKSTSDSRLERRSRRHAIIEQDEEKISFDEDDEDEDDDMDHYDGKDFSSSPRSEKKRKYSSNSDSEQMDAERQEMLEDFKDAEEDNEDGDSELCDSLDDAKAIESTLEELRLATKSSFSVGVKMTNAQRIKYLKQKKDAHQTAGTQRAIRMAMELDEKRRDKAKLSLRQRMLESLKKTSTGVDDTLLLEDPKSTSTLEEDLVSDPTPATQDQ